MPSAVRRAGMPAVRRPVRIIAASFVLIVAALLGPVGTLADTTAVTDCAPPLPVERAAASADLVFVGTVSAIGNDGRSATVDVSEVWRGDVPATVLVNGGPTRRTQARTIGRSPRVPPTCSCRRTSAASATGC